MPTSAADAFRPLHELAGELRSGRLRAAELVELYLERIARYGDRLHAYVCVYADEARLVAEAADKALRAGQDLGPLHGMPIAVKDIIDMEGRITTAGSKAWRERVSAVTATVVRRLMAAGAIVIGKTHTVELAFGGWGTNEHCGTPWNPWDLHTHRVPGGSSSGSAVATAAALAAAGIGTDTGGSVRLPAAFCGLVGLKTTVGRISTHGIVPLSATLDSVGPLTRSVEDAALLCNALQGPDPAQPATQGVALDDTLAPLRRGVEGMRLAALPSAERGSVDPEVLSAYDASLATLAELGAEIVDVELPQPFSAYTQANATIMEAEGYVENEALIERDDLPLDRHVRERFRRGRGIGAAAYVRVLRQRAQAAHAFDEALDGVDALLTPTTATPAIAVADVDESVSPAHFTRAGNFVGLCGLAVPNGLTAAGLPTSLLINGRAFDEARVLRIGWALEQAHAPQARVVPSGLD